MNAVWISRSFNVPGGTIRVPMFWFVEPHSVTFLWSGRLHSQMVDVAQLVDKWLKR